MIGLIVGKQSILMIMWTILKVRSLLGFLLMCRWRRGSIIGFLRWVLGIGCQSGRWIMGCMRNVILIKIKWKILVKRSSYRCIYVMRLKIRAKCFGYIRINDFVVFHFPSLLSRITNIVYPYKAIPWILESCTLDIAESSSNTHKI